MGREVRRVPKDWAHPLNERSRPKPLIDGSFAKAKAEYELGKQKWDEGLVDDLEGGWKPKSEEASRYSYEDWAGGCPREADYMPDWPEEQRTHLQMYETTTEGTPISPVMATPEELARWLADNKASAFAGRTATYEQWLATIKAGWAVSGVIVNGQIKSGVEVSTNP